VQIGSPDFDRMFGAVANHTRRNIVRRLLDQYEELWRGRIDRMTELIAYAREEGR
jgi:hypothetical protein